MKQETKILLWCSFLSLAGVLNEIFVVTFPKIEIMIEFFALSAIFAGLAKQVEGI